MSKVKLPPNEVLPFCQYHALNKCDILEDLIKSQDNPKPHLQRLVSLADDLDQNSEECRDIISEVQSWLPIAKKTMSEEDMYFIEWQANKNKFTF